MGTFLNLVKKIPEEQKKTKITDEASMRIDYNQMYL